LVFYADYRFAHYVSHGVGYLEWVANHQQFGLAFALGIHCYVSVAKDSAADGLVNQQVAEARGRNHKRVESQYAVVHF
jgi:hypothetical protein